MSSLFQNEMVAIINSGNVYFSCNTATIEKFENMINKIYMLYFNTHLSMQYACLFIEIREFAYYSLIHYTFLFIITNIIYFVDPMTYLQEDMNTIHPWFLSVPDNEVNSQVQKLLTKLSVCQLSPPDVINRHILPVLKSDMWKVC